MPLCIRNPSTECWWSFLKRSNHTASYFMNRFLRIFMHAWMAIFCVIGGFVGYTIFSVPDVSYLKNVTPDTTAFMQHRLLEADIAGDTLDLKRSLVAFADVPKVVRRAVVVAEDASFWVHEGVDWHEVEEAINQNREEGKKLRGASTITQQTAKNLFLSPKRSFLRKAREFLITKELEYTLSKSRILELYLNSIEFGKGIFGIRSASLHYFSKEPDEMSLFELSRLVAIIPKPLTLSPVEPSRELRWRSRIVLRRLHKYNFVSNKDYYAAREEFTEFFKEL